MAETKYDTSKTAFTEPLYSKVRQEGWSPGVEIHLGRPADEWEVRGVIKGLVRAYNFYKNCNTNRLDSPGWMSRYADGRLELDECITGTLSDGVFLGDSKPFSFPGPDKEPAGKTLWGNYASALSLSEDESSIWGNVTAQVILMQRPSLEKNPAGPLSSEVDTLVFGAFKRDLQQLDRRELLEEILADPSFKVFLDAHELKDLNPTLTEKLPILYSRFLKGGYSSIVDLGNFAQTMQTLSDEHGFEYEPFRINPGNKEPSAQATLGHAALGLGVEITIQSRVAGLRSGREQPELSMTQLEEGVIKVHAPDPNDPIETEFSMVPVITNKKGEARYFDSRPNPIPLTKRRDAKKLINSVNTLINTLPLRDDS